MTKFEEIHERDVMTYRWSLATTAMALPLVLLACAPREPAVETVVADSLPEGQRNACRAAVAQQIGQTAGDVTDTLVSVTPSGTAMYTMHSTAGDYSCEVDNAFQVVNLAPLAGS